MSTNLDDPARPTTTASTPRERVVTGLPADPRPLLARAVATTRRTIDGVAPAQLGDPTPCTELDVRAMIEHLVEVAQRITALGSGDDPMALPGVPAGLDLDGLRAAFAEHGAAALAAFADERRLDDPISLPWATMPGRGHLATYTNELTVHTWDLAVATGQEVPSDPAVIELAESAIRAAFPPERTSVFAAIWAQTPPELRREGYPWKDAVEAPSGAAPIERLVAYNGRRPDWHPAA